MHDEVHVVFDHEDRQGEAPVNLLNVRGERPGLFGVTYNYQIKLFQKPLMIYQELIS